MASANTVQGLINQQLGISNWRTCDNAMERLRCTARDDFCNISYETAVGEEEFFDSPVFACKFAQKQGYEHVLALANEDGHTAVLDTRRMERSSRQVHCNAIFDLAWMFNQMRLVTVSGDHSAKLVDVCDDGMRVVRMFTGHTRSVKTLAVKRDDSSVFATGGRDGSVLLWDTRSLSCAAFVSSPDKAIRYAHGRAPSGGRRAPALSALNSVTGLAFHDANTLVSCGAGDGSIKVWDLRRTYKTDRREPLPRGSIPYARGGRRCGFSSLAVDAAGGRLYATCLDSVIYCYNVLTCDPSPVMRYSGHRANTFYVKSCLSGDGAYLLSGSSDQNAYVWNTKFAEPVVRLRGHAAEVTCVAWCQDVDAALVTCSDDFRHKIWRVGPEVVPENWRVDGRGEAEVPTPRRRKRALETERIARARKRSKSCRYCVDDARYCENCNSNEARSAKRINLSHGATPNNKRFKTSRPDDVLTETSENNFIEQPKRLKLFDGTPRSAARPDETSPASSPTLNLPNFNVDGCAPHLNHSPQKKLDRDWLTKLRTEKHPVLEMREQASPTSPSLRLEESPRTRSAKRQRTEQRLNSPRSPLLKFFRVTNNSIMKDSSCVSKASLAQDGSGDN